MLFFAFYATFHLLTVWGNLNIALKLTILSIMIFIFRVVQHLHLKCQCRCDEHDADDQDVAITSRPCLLGYHYCFKMFDLSVISHQIIQTYTNKCTSNKGYYVAKHHVLRLFERNTRTRESWVIYAVLQNFTSNTIS